MDFDEVQLHAVYAFLKRLDLNFPEDTAVAFVEMG